MNSINDFRLAGLEEGESTIFCKAETIEDAITHRENLKAFFTLSFAMSILLIIVIWFYTTGTSFLWTALCLITVMGGFFLPSGFGSLSHALKFLKKCLEATKPDGFEAPKNACDRLSIDITARGATGTAIFDLDDSGQTTISIVDIKTPDEIIIEQYMERRKALFAKNRPYWDKVDATIASLERDPLYPKAEIDETSSEFRWMGYGAKNRFNDIIQKYTAQ